MRTRGSCRFEPYYKVQVWDPVAVAWRDIQRAHPSEEEARTAAPAGKRFRLVRVTEAGREFGEEERRT